MMKVKIVSVGKNKEAWLEEALAEYAKRLQVIIEIQYEWVNDDAQLLRIIQKESNLVCLDPKGPMMNSEQFASFLRKKLETGGARLTFIIGGAEGLPDQIRENHPLLSLSLMTFTHQISRLILVEQIYRATEIWKGSQYHK